MKGLYQKYIVTRANGKPLSEEFEAIVLQIDGGQYLEACRIGVQAFATAVREQNHILANDIERRLQELAVEDIIMKPKNEPKGSFFNP